MAYAITNENNPLVEHGYYLYYKANQYLLSERPSVIRDNDTI